MGDTLLIIRTTIEELLDEIRRGMSPMEIKRLSKAIKNLSEAYYELAESESRYGGNEE